LHPRASHADLPVWPLDETAIVTTFVQETSGLSEEQILFKGDSADLYGVVYEPSGPRLGTLVICAADGNERTWTQRVLVRTARALAQNGISVLRFDYRGQGESSGDYEGATVETRLQDIASALEVASLRRPSPAHPIGLLGTRLGGTLAMLTAAERPDVAPVILWEPILDPPAYLQELLRVNVSAQTQVHKKVLRSRAQLLEAIRAGEKVSVNGYNLCRPFVDELLQLSLEGPWSRCASRLRVILGAATKQRWTGSPEPVRVDFPMFWNELRTYHGSIPALVQPTLGWIRESLSSTAAHRS